MLSDYEIVLASGSPRRRELLELLGVKFRKAPSLEVAEVYPDTLPASEVALYLATLKADAYRPMVRPGEMFITADTVVILDGQVLGKPATLDDARRMLAMLSGRTHQVITGVCVFTTDRTERFSVTTDVEFGQLSGDDIDSYVNECRPLDKAGAYGIQERIGAIGVRGIHGSFYNVMGLPVHRLYATMKLF